MKLLELKDRFNKKFVIKVVAGVLVVSLITGSTYVYNVYGEKKDAVEVSTEVAESEKDTENDLSADEEIGSLIQSSLGVTEEESGKDETVYVIADAYGNEGEKIVSEWLKNTDGSDTLKDSSTLKNITNVKGNETFTQDGDEITWNAEGNDIYYQGTTDKEVPVTEKVTYYMDGEEMSAEDIAGKSGHLKIRIDYTNNQTEDVEINGKKETITVPFIVASGMVLNDKFRNIEVSNGKVISNGSSDIVLGIATPGLKESLGIEDEDKLEDVEIPEYVEMEADVEDFEMSSILTVVTNSSTLDVNDLELDDLDDKIDELQDGSSKLVDGSDELADGVDTLNDSLGDFSKGMGDLKTGIKNYTDGAKQVADGISTLNSNTSALKSGVGTLNSSASTLNSGVSKLDKALKTAMTDEEKAAAKQSAKETVDAQMADDSNATSYNNIKNQASTTFYNTVASEENKTAAAAQAATSATNTINGQVDAIKAAAVQAVDAQMADDSNATSYNNIKNQATAAFTSAISNDATNTQIASSISGAVDQVSTAVATSSADATVNATIAQLQQAAASLDTSTAEGAYAAGVINNIVANLSNQNTKDSIKNAVAAGVLGSDTYTGARNNASSQLAAGITGSIASSAAGTVGTTVADTAKTAAETAAGTAAVSAAQQVAGSVASEVASSVVESVASSAKDSVGTSVADAVKTAAETAAGTAAISGAESAKSKIAASIEAKDSKTGYSLVTGMQALASGTDTLNTSVGTLSDGITKLYNGSNTLVSNNGTLNDGATKLNDATGKIVDGVSALDDGANDLAEGMLKLDEKGIEKLVDTYNGDVKDVTERLKAVVDAGHDYDNFSGKAEGTVGTTKFIIKTAAIEK
ncbi:MAG: hypothetical protein K6F37_07155 [Lachnospiraceae bacterium]|nr:hypothetical protein [Lachnospiraceae bacterium]